MDISLLDIVDRMAPLLGLDGLSHLARMIMDDKKPKFVDGIYIFAETSDNEWSSFESCIELMKRDCAAEVFIFNGGGKGTPGYAHWVERLGKYIDRARIRPIAPIKYPKTIRDDFVNTLTESQALVKFANETNRHSFYLIAPPFHMIRAYMTAASEAIRHKSQINFFAYPGAPQDLKKNVTHSQGNGPFPRLKWFEMELRKISDYSEKDGIKLPLGTIRYEPVLDIIKYMENRKL